MAKLDGIQRLKREDFDEKDKGLIDKLGGILNPFLEQIQSAFNKNLNFENLRQEMKDIIVTVDGSGLPTTQTQFKNNLISKLQGTQVIKAENLTDGTITPTSQPFIFYSENSNIVTIIKVTGLQASNKYKLTMITYG